MSSDDAPRPEIAVAVTGLREAPQAPGDHTPVRTPNGHVSRAVADTIEARLRATRDPRPQDAGHEPQDAGQEASDAGHETQDADRAPRATDPAQHSGSVDALVSLHYVRAVVRRRRRGIALGGAVGMLLGGGFLLASPSPHVASTSLVLRHGAGGDPWRAMLTDVSLTGTRTIAQQTVQALGLPLTAEQLQGTLVVPTPTSEVLTMTMTGPSDAEAVRRLAKFTDVYLAFRARTLSIQTDVTVEGYRRQVKALQTLRSQVQVQIDTLGSSSARVPQGQDSFSDLITRRAQIDGQISGLEGQVQETELQRDAVLRASLVIDPAAAQPAKGRSRIVLPIGSGLIGGLGLGFGLAILSALLSDRLLMREEFAAALDGPVRCSVRSLLPPGPPARVLRFLPWLRATSDRRAVDLANVAVAVREALPPGPGARRLVVACVDSADEARHAVAAAALHLRDAGCDVQLVDLTGAGRLGKAVARLVPPGTERPPVLRPSVLPALATPPAELEGAGAGDRPDGEPGAVQLVLADVSLDIGLHHLRAWADDVLVAVVAGRSAAQRIRTTRDLVDAAGLTLHGALLFRTDPSDTSSGA